MKTSAGREAGAAEPEPEPRLLELEERSALEGRSALEERSALGSRSPSSGAAGAVGVGAGDVEARASARAASEPRSEGRRQLQLLEGCLEVFTGQSNTLQYRYVALRVLVEL